MNNNTNTLDLAIEEDIELLEYITAILRHKYKIFFISMLGATAMFSLTFLMPIKYESVVKLALVKVNNLGGVKPDNRQAPEAVTLVEQDFIAKTVYENYQDRVIARMRSRLFTKKFITDNDLLPIIFYKRWDKDKKQWKKGFKPNMILAEEIFNQSICSVNRNPENDLMVVKVSAGSPQLAAKIADKFVTDFNDYSRSYDINEANRKIDFLKKTITETSFLEIHKSLYRLIEAQLVIKMLASNKKEYKLEVLDPASIPLYKSSPASKKMTALTFVGFSVLSIVFIIGRIVFTRMQVSIKQYQRDHPITKKSITKKPIKQKSNKNSNINSNEEHNKTDKEGDL